MVSEQSSYNHGLLIKSVIKILKKGKFKQIRAKIPGYEKPEAIGKEANGKGYIPDIIAQREIEVIFEIETRNSMGSRYTDVKWRAFDKHARENNKTFYIIVPQGLSNRVKERADKLKIFPKIMVI
ncbi:hypothetical protein ACFL5S_00025 [Fibrobacterota bacterium]